MSSTHNKHRTGVELDNVLPGSGEYQFVEGKSSKFWRCEPVGDPYGDYKITWGRIGTQGQSQEIPRATAAKRIREKVSKGYELVQSFTITEAERERNAAKKRLEEKKSNRQLQTAFIEELYKIS